MENDTYEQIVTQLEQQLEQDALETPDKLLINTVKQQATKSNPESPKPVFHDCKQPGHYQNQTKRSRQIQQK